MRRFLPSASLIIFLFTLMGFCVGLFLAVAAPFRPGNPFFAAQHFAEAQRSRFNFSDSGKASYYLSLVERRTVDLVMLNGTNQEQAAVEALANAIQDAEQAVAQAPESDRPALFDQMAVVARKADSSLASSHLSQAQIPDIYIALEARLATLQQLIADDKLAERDVIKARTLILLPYIPAETNPPAAEINLQDSIDPLQISFLEGSAGAEHAFFPLEGQHEELSCESCHASGVFSGTPRQCASCHSQAAPVNHFPGDCASCHNSFSWADARFEHRLASGMSCTSCHSKDKPANHFSGQCSACHSTNAWKPARFNHQATGAADCSGCHTKNKPANHFSGQCSTCHSTSAWRPAKLDHTGLTDCASCHTKNKPANHYSGQCSTCHSTNAWRPASFSHNGLTDCASCHSNDRPANHYSGQCSACHSTSAWKPASFSHNGLTDCTSCHSNDRPANHWSGQCSRCHNTSGWSGIQVKNHTFPVDHKNAGGVCARCHPSKTAEWTCYQCHDRAETEKHHAEKDILNIATRCIECHPTGKD